MSVLTTWVKPINNIKGQDHLATRAVCEKLYTQLISGITNVTDRARYYSFYPWLIWAFEKHTGNLKNRPLQDSIRRAECLFTLIGEWHTRETKQDKRSHGAAMVGREKLNLALNLIEEGQIVELSTYSTLNDSPHRYFKNKWGGLGQYYLGTLLELGILFGSSRTELKYTRERGDVIAEVFDQQVEREKFFEVLESDCVDIDVLEQLKGFCPCFLKTNESERNVLINLFFNNSEAFYEESSQNRRRTLGLILNLISELEKTGQNNLQVPFVELFRSCVYTGTLPNGLIWQVPLGLKSIREGWQLYQFNEMFSIAVQAIFWAGLNKLQIESIFLKDSQEYKEWFLLTFAEDVLQSDQHQSFEDKLLYTQFSIPLLEDFSNVSHEIRLYNELLSSFAKSEKEAIGKALSVLLVLAARYQDIMYPYSGYISNKYLVNYPVNLHMFLYHCRNTWKNLTVSEMLGWLAMNWGIEWHFNVALRKLRYETKDTFRIKPTDQGLKVIEVPFPAYSSPRIAQAQNMLYDLAIIYDEQGSIQITNEGIRLMEGCCG